MQPLDLSKVREYGNLELLARQLVDGFITGLHKSPYHGFSVEFAEHRLYNNGESTRHIDWKVFARTDRLYTKVYEEETNLRCMILLDTSSSMYYPRKSHDPAHEHRKIRFAALAAGSLAYMLQRQRDAVGLCTFGQQIETLTPVKSTAVHLSTLFGHLQQPLGRQDPDSLQRSTSVAPVIHEIAERLHRRSLVIVLSDMFDQRDPDELFAALRHLRHNHHEVLLFHVFDQHLEVEFGFDDRPTLFVDVETGQQIKAQPSQVRQAYQQQVEERFQTLKLRCGQYKIDFVTADVRQGLDQILLPYLIRRTRMR